MISDEQLDEWRINATRIKVIRDANPANDIKGNIVAWDGDTILVRKQNRKVVKLPREYKYEPFDKER